MISLLQDQTSGLAGLDNLLGALAMIAALFLVVAAVGEQISETLRVKFPRMFAWLGIPSLRGGISLDDALAKAREFLPENTPALAKAEALARVGSAHAAALTNISEQIESITALIRQTAGAEQTGAIPADQLEALVTVTNTVTERLSAVETDRIVALRTLSFIVCLAVCYAANFNAFAIVAEAFPAYAAEKTGAGNWLTQIFGGVHEFLTSIFGDIDAFGGMVVTAFAAASGSGYWHDQLDRIRAVKSAVGSAKNIVAQT